MRKLRTICAFLLALPLVAFGANFFYEFIPEPETVVGPGMQMLLDMRAGGLMLPVAISHLAIGLLLLIPRTRFSAGLLQLPMSLGILGFHLTMMPEGLPIAVGLLLLNLGVVLDARRLAGLFAADPE